ncbi:MAG TPA: M15 family metallopeptidase [Steroidobacteraceae bacterium]|nr:M15 family metallopeptidase [Steroidobacteraceae bacterium]
MLNSFELTGRAATHVREVSGTGWLLEARTGAAVLALREAASAVGIELVVVSGFRDFARQAAIWTAKFTGGRPLFDREGHEMTHARLDAGELIDAILLWSALPGASRHHWGTEVDVIDAACLPEGARPQLLPHEFAPGGCFAPLDRWLTANMARFGFFRPYVTERGGVQPEPWHLSYAPVSVPALAALSVDVLREALAGASLPGGELLLERLPELYRRYVLAVDQPAAGGQSAGRPAGKS